LPQLHGFRNIERHHQRELAISKSNGPKRAIKTPRQRSGGSLGRKAQACLADLMNDIEGDFV
jgi:hypothetical protein